MQSKRKDAEAGARVRARGAGGMNLAVWAIWPALLAPLWIVASAWANEQQRPPFSQVAVAVANALIQTTPEIRSGDLIGQRQVAAALAAAEQIGWNVPQADTLVARALPDNSFLLELQSTPRGKRFIRKVAKQPGGIIRLDRLSSISRGEKLIRDLSNDKGGDLMIEYLAATNGGHEMGQMMAETPGGVDLNKPTGRIYTVEDLLYTLRDLYRGKPQR